MRPVWKRLVNPDIGNGSNPQQCCGAMFLTAGSSLSNVAQLKKCPASFNDSSIWIGCIESSLTPIWLLQLVFLYPLAEKLGYL